MKWPWNKKIVWEAIPQCVICGQGSAHICLLDDKEGAKQSPPELRLTYTGPGGSSGSGHLISQERAQLIMAGFSQPYQASRIREADFYDDAGFCLECSAFYCVAHWNVTASGGGYCPRGHFKSLDTHWSPAWDDG